MVRVSSEEASSRRNKGEPRRGDQSEDEIVQDGHVVSCGMFFETGLVFVQGYIPGIVQAVFDTPIGAQHFKELGRRSLFSR